MMVVTSPTFKKIKKISRKNYFIKVFKNKKKGLGSAIEVGIKKSTHDFVSIFMSDSSDSISDLISYYKIISKKNYDSVLGSRFLKKSKVKNYPLLKLILNRIFNNLVKFIFFSNLK